MAVLQLLLDASLCAAYLGLNAALNFANRWALGVRGFAFPMTLTAAHMLLNPAFLAPVMLLMEAYRREHRRVVGGNWRALLLVGTLNGVQICMNNSSLVHIELSMNQVVRATMPVFVALCDCARGVPPKSSQLPVLVGISVGVILVVHQSSAGVGEWKGALLVALSVFLQAAQMSFAGGALSVKLDSFQMTFYTSPLALLSLAGPTCAVEGALFRQYAMERPGVTWLVLVGTCALAVVYNVVLFQTIHRFSAIGSSVLGNCKVVVLLLLSSLLMGEMRHWQARQYIGCWLTFGGAAVYSMQRMRGGGQKSNAQTTNGKDKKNK